MFQRLMLVLAAFLGFALVGVAGAQTAITPFSATDLAGVSAIVVAFLAVGALINIGMTLYRKGKQASNKV
jgi:hypothetical protein